MQLEMRGVNFEMDDDLREHIERRLRFALGRFSARIDRTVVRMSDVNGPRGGVDKRCLIAVILIPSGIVRVEGAGEEAFALATSVARRVGQAVRQTLGRRRRRALRAEGPGGPGRPHDDLAGQPESQGWPGSTASTDAA